MLHGNMRVKEERDVKGLPGKWKYFISSKLEWGITGKDDIQECMFKTKLIIY